MNLIHRCAYPQNADNESYEYYAAHNIAEMFDKSIGKQF